MGALRKAGVWLGLVEEDDDRHDGGVFDDEYADYDDYAEPARARSIARPRAPERRVPEARAREDRAPSGLASDGYQPEPRTRGSYERDRREQPDGRGLFDHESRPGTDRTATDRSATDRSATDRARFDRTGTDRGDVDRGAAERGGADRTGTDGGTVRHLARPSGKTINFPTRDNLALAPQVQLNERAVVGDQPGQRYQITTLHPTSYSDARTIGEHFRDGRPVIINLTELDEADAKRLVDFAAGLAFGLRGGMDRVTNRVFLLTPANVEVSAEDKARIAEGRFFDQG